MSHPLLVDMLRRVASSIFRALPPSPPREGVAGDPLNACIDVCHQGMPRGLDGVPRVQVSDCWHWNKSFRPLLEMQFLAPPLSSPPRQILCPGVCPLLSSLILASALRI